MDRTEATKSREVANSAVNVGAGLALLAGNSDVMRLSKGCRPSRIALRFPQGRFFCGTLEPRLILKTLARSGDMHGYEIANSIQRISDDVLQVEEGSLYPALQRMLIKGWVTAKWGTTAGNRRARYYQLTAAGRKQLAVEMSQFERVIGAITRVIEAV